MATPVGITTLYVQQANGTVLLTWNAVPSATSYSVQRSTDNATWTTIASPTGLSYSDTTGTVGTLYYYQVAAVNSSGTSPYTQSQSVVPVNAGDMSLGQLRLAAQQRADRVNSNFVTLPEWNSYIGQSYYELYDLLITLYEDFFVKAPYTFATDGTTSQYTLPTDFYKLLGVDMGYPNASGQGWITVKKYNFIARNRFVFPQVNSALVGVYNPQYRLMGNTIMFIPTLSAGQSVRLWYIPKLTQPLADTDIITGVSGWTEYIIVDAAIKALQKEESDVTILMAQKGALIKRIEESAMNRDAGQADTISNVRTRSEMFGQFSGPGYDGSFGGY